MAGARDGTHGPETLMPQPLAGLRDVEEYIALHHVGSWHWILNLEQHPEFASIAIDGRKGYRITWAQGAAPSSASAAASAPSDENPFAGLR